MHAGRNTLGNIVERIVFNCNHHIGLVIGINPGGYERILVAKPHGRLGLEEYGGLKSYMHVLFQRLPPHARNIFHRNRTLVPEEGHKDGKADSGLCGGDGQNEHGENLALQITEE